MTKKNLLTIDSPLLAKYQTTLHQSSIGLWEWTREGDTIQCDRGVCRLYGFDAEELNGPSSQWYNLIIPEDREMTRQTIDRAWNDEIEIDSKFRIQLSSGEIKHIRTSAVKIYSENKKVTHLVGLNWDVTKESTLKKDLAAVKNFLQNIIDSVPDPIFVKNRQHQWIYGNQEFANLLGVSKEKLIGKSDGEFFGDILKNTSWDYDEKVFISGIASENEEIIRDSNGEFRDILTKKSLMAKVEPGTEFGEGPMLVGIIRDITEIKKIQKSFVEQSKLASLGEVSAGMAHEINNPLSIISGKMMILKTQLERETSVDPIRLQQTCDAVLKNCQRIEKIVRALNSFSRNTKGDPFEDIPVVEILEELKEFIGEKLDKAEIKFEIQLHDEELAVSGRASEIIQVFINLVSNSFDAVRGTHEPWIRIVVKSIKNRIEIEVTDSGEGIPPEIAAQMMEFFYTTKPAGQGTGLGLSLTRQIMKTHSGSIEYLADRKNTTFKLEFPAVF